MDALLNTTDLTAPETILIVDDNEINRGVLATIFEDEYAIEEAENGLAGLDMLTADPDKYCAVLLDVMMPVMNGMEMLQHMNETGLQKNIPVFLITADRNDDTMADAYRLGVMDFILKPVVPYIVLRRVNSVVELFRARKRLGARVIQQDRDLLDRAKQIIALNEGLIGALATAVEFRDGESGEHVQRINKITEIMLSDTELGADLTPEEIHDISLASVMHDVGKIAIPDGILGKPGKLTPEEFAVMKTHTIRGAEMLEKIPQLRDTSIYDYAYDIALHHHERWDGRGYPEGLKGDEISLWAQVVSLADVYDALSCKRVYKAAFPREVVLEMIREGQCGIFNPRLLECFFSVEEKLSQLYGEQAAPVKID